MNERQQRFVQEYVTNGFNAHRAAIDAGYSAHTALVRSFKMPLSPSIKPAIAKGIAHTHQVLENELKITVSKKANWLIAIIERVLDKDMPDQYKDAIKAIAELNKMQGHHAPSRSLSITLDATKEKLLDAQRQYKEF